MANEDRGGTGERYAYDLCGNRLIREQYRNGSVDVTERYRYNERNELTERVRAGILTTYRYDKNGSIISEEEEGRKSEYRYDLLNRQTYVKSLEGKEQENFYDGEGLRAGLTENGKRTTFLFHNGEILAECDGESAPIRRHVRGLRLSHVQTLYNGAYHTYHQDEQGSTAYITGQDNAAENCYQYDVFGNLTEKHECIKNRILYTDQQYDQETGQYYLRARYYNPVVGRFLQEDTYRGDGLNLYAYCANNPVMYYDPSGHQKCKGSGDNNQGSTRGNQVGGEGGSEIRNRYGQPVVPTEKTLDMALDPETYANAIADKYGINLRGSGENITIRYNPDLRPGIYGRTTAANPNVIEIGSDALISETELANTIAHELNHARSFLKGGQALEPPAYNSGNALSDYINGGR